MYVIFRYPSLFSLSLAFSENSGILSTVYTASENSAKSAVWYPDPVPISSTLLSLPGSSSHVISITRLGCEIVCPWPMGSGRSRPASSLYPLSTKTERSSFSKKSKSLSLSMSFTPNGPARASDIVSPL